MLLATHGIIQDGQVPPLPAGATARWDASMLSGSDGDLIATFSDIIGTNHGTAAGSARATLKTGGNGLNGMNVLRFNGVANAYDLTSVISQTDVWSIVCVVKRNGAEASPISNDAYIPSLVRVAANAVIGDRSGYTEFSSAHTGWELIAASANAGARLCRLNGVALSGGATAYVSTAPFKYIGKRLTAGNYSSMDLADAVLYAGVALSDADLLAASANLNAKWGVF